MRIVVDGKEMEVRSLWLEDAERGIVTFIDQRYLPWKIEFFRSLSYRDTVYAIKEMVVRGAPAIGLAGAYGVLQAYVEHPEKDFVRRAAKELESARPTAVHLSLRVRQMLEAALKLISEGEKKGIRELARLAESIAEEEIRANLRIGELGVGFLEDGYRVMTHCNAGALAAIDVGTALAPIRVAHRRGLRIHVYVPETRPWLQGSRLTAWELEMEGIPYSIITDNAACYLIWRGDVDAIIVGADRIAANGDVINKIGTYKLAVCAKESGVPFYVAAPLSTFDFSIESGDQVVIENRSPDEVLFVRGFSESGKIDSVLIGPRGARALNPVFDVTPFKYVTAIITEAGIIRSEEDIRRIASGTVGEPP